MATSGSKPFTTSLTGDTFRCPICLEEVRSPKYLSSHHTFCGSCIQTYISSTAKSHESEGLKTIDCPVCRKLISAPRKDISDEEWASSLPQNKLIVSIWLNPKNNENKLCNFCERSEKNVPAKHWCKACMEIICDECKAFHNRVPSLQKHKIVKMADRSISENEFEVEEFCLEHDGKLIDAFCHLHQKLCCCICLVRHHRLCPNVKAIADIGVETEQHDVQSIILSFSELEKCIENMQEQNKTKIVDLTLMKQEICTNAEKAVQEMKTLIDDAHAGWIKAFEQTHADSVGNLETASDELRRFSTTVLETKILLQSMLKSGSPKQLFITKQNQLARIVDHINRMTSLDIWNFPDQYTKPDCNFLKQLLNEKKFEEVMLSKTPSGTIQAILQTVPKVIGKDIIKKKHENSQKDWMKINLKFVSGITLSAFVYYGLFIHDTKIILPFKNPSSLKLFDISDCRGKCIHTEVCPSAPYGLCHSRENESLDEIYVSFLNSVVVYWIDIENGAKFTKLQTVHLNEPMISITCGLATIFSANNDKVFICSRDFNVEHSATLKNTLSEVPFISSSWKSDYHCFSNNNHVVVADRNNTTIFQNNKVKGNIRGLTFDLHDNILACTRTSKLKQIRCGKRKSRDIELDGIRDSYNVVLHPTGEKIMVFDYHDKCCVYQVL
uniref:TRIM56 n=3 Tax=Magallana gigas TaxID=29159 RepID=A0A8W8NQH4_MAGGI